MNNEDRTIINFGKNKDHIPIKEKSFDDMYDLNNFIKIKTKNNKTIDIINIQKFESFDGLRLIESDYSDDCKIESDTSISYILFYREILQVTEEEIPKQEDISKHKTIDEYLNELKNELSIVKKIASENSKKAKKRLFR